MKYTNLPYPVFQPFHPPYAKLNLYLYIFSHFKKFHSSFLMNKLLWYKLRPFKQSYLATMFFKVTQYGYETFHNVAPSLRSVICSEMNTALITNKKLL